MLLLVTSVLSTPARAADDAALATVEACRARLDARGDIGMEKISRRCPELLPALENAAWKDLLPLGLRERRDEVSAESLRELADLVRRANEEAGGPAPDPESLAPVLAELGERGQQGATRWERLKRWFKEKLERRNQEEQGKSWLDGLGEQFRTSEGVARLITYAGYALLAALVLLVVWSELRAAGLLGGMRRETPRTRAAAAWRRRLLLADVMDAPLSERPGLLLQLLGEALTRTRRLPAAAGLTAGALVRQARLDSDAEREELARVASTAEAVRFAPQAPADEQLEGAVVSGRTLLERLSDGRRGDTA